MKFKFANSIVKTFSFPKAEFNQWMDFINFYNQTHLTEFIEIYFNFLHNIESKG